jgi:hypothetical protein
VSGGRDCGSVLAAGACSVVFSIVLSVALSCPQDKIKNKQRRDNVIFIIGFLV